MPAAATANPGLPHIQDWAMIQPAYASTLAGHEVYSTPVKRRLKGHASLRVADDDQAPGVQKPNASADIRANFVFGLSAVVLTTGQLVGRSYIDPGNGIFAIQIIIAAGLGGILSARLGLRHVFW